MSEPCYFCGKLKPVAFSLRDEKGDHPVCKDCAEKWAEDGSDWPKRPKILIVFGVDAGR